MEIASLTSTITNMKTQNMTLENNLNSMKHTNKQTIDYQSEQLTNVQDRWKSEKEILLKKRFARIGKIEKKIWQS